LFGRLGDWSFGRLGDWSFGRLGDWSFGLCRLRQEPSICEAEVKLFNPNHFGVFLSQNLHNSAKNINFATCFYSRFKKEINCSL
jgi:hypothetical protein